MIPANAHRRSAAHALSGPEPGQGTKQDLPPRLLLRYVRTGGTIGLRVRLNKWLIGQSLRQHRPVACVLYGHFSDYPVHGRFSKYELESFVFEVCGGLYETVSGA